MKYPKDNIKDFYDKFMITLSNSISKFYIKVLGKKENKISMIKSVGLLENRLEKLLMNP